MWIKQKLKSNLIKPNERDMYMLKRIETPNCNIDNSVEFILRGAKKRRSMAMANARMLNAEQGIQQKLVAVK